MARPCLVNQPGLDAFKYAACDIAYLYDVTWKGNQLHVIVYETDERNGFWTRTGIFAGSLREMQERYGLKYL